MNKIIGDCIINRANGILNILKDIKNCKSETMIHLGYNEIESLASGMIKMIERENKRGNKNVY